MKKTKLLSISLVLLFPLNVFAQDEIIEKTNDIIEITNDIIDVTNDIIDVTNNIIDVTNDVIALPELDELETESFTHAEESPEDKYLKMNNIHDNDEVYITVDKIARFPGGEEQMRRYIDRQIQFPEELIDTEIQGQVCLNFIVRKTGEITDIQIVRSVHPLLDEEAVRVVKSMPKWIPANYMGPFVSSSYELFIFFKNKKINK